MKGIDQSLYNQFQSSFPWITSGTYISYMDEDLTATVKAIAQQVLLEVLARFYTTNQ